MCDALMELMRDELKDEFDKIRADAHSAGETEGLEAGRREGLETGRKEGLSIGRREGQAQERQEGIKVLIESCQDLKISKESTVSQLMIRYSLDRKTAGDSVEKYWK